MLKRLTAVAAAAALAAAAAAPAAHAQSWGDRLKKRAEEAAKRATENRVDQKSTEATNAAMDAAENTVKCAANDKKCADAAKKAGKTVETVPASGAAAAPGAAATASDAGESSAAPARPGEGAWANYDFKPGDRIVYADDFTRDEVGDFPRRMEFKAGALEIVEWQGGRWLRATAPSRWYIPLPEVLPDRFTMEFDYAIPNGEVWIALDDKGKEDQQQRLEFGGEGTAEANNYNTHVQASGRYGTERTHKLRHARVLGDGQYIKVYIDDKRILNVPNADLGRSKRIFFNTDASTENPALFGNIRIAAGGKKLYEALSASGRVATQGIYFDTGSDRIRPESSPTLKEIAGMLSEHPDLKLTIEGHTDDVGSAASNLTLSQKRADAVKATLVSSYGVSADRLAAKGLGQTKPAAPNTTNEGRAQNRRVELVKM